MENIYICKEIHTDLASKRKENNTTYKFLIPRRNNPVLAVAKITTNVRLEWFIFSRFYTDECSAPPTYNSIHSVAHSFGY